ncbi:hypothetical protein H206_07247 [Candidatus Electrothrix aarhusensis]|uniref:Uncharacterized protein n=1 Tax=Candidatus Electrothrix aarhusensis TaxID=1859131 RepID=A0A3S4TBY9_9BACT|nr:hypothetical protein H206_07247 [Candidatus Electrothrix aarhusensis]
MVLVSSKLYKTLTRKNVKLFFEQTCLAVFVSF